MMKKKKLDKRKKLTSAEEKDLWGSAAGRCAICKKYLIQQVNSEGNRIYNMGEHAHVIPAGDENAPRGEYHLSDYEISESNRDKIDNIVLLCKPHHKEVDDHPSHWTPQELYDLKDKHLDWVRNQLDIDGKQLAVIFGTKTLFMNDISFSQNSSEVYLSQINDVRAFPNIMGEKDWKEGLIFISSLIEKIGGESQEFDGVGLFAIAHIPFLIYLGHKIPNKLPIKVFQFDREANHWTRENSPEENKLIFEKITSSFHAEKGEITSGLIVMVSVSGIVDRREVDSSVGFSKNMNVLEISLQNPQIDAILFRNDVEVFVNFFYQELIKYVNKHKYTKIHLFAAIPAGVAIEIGRTINLNLIPPIDIYEFNRRATASHTYAITM